jgi:hypothetical protein
VDTRILDATTATNYANQDYMRVNYTLTVVYTTSMLLVTGSQSKNVSSFYLGFSVYWCSRLNGRIEYIETIAGGHDGVSHPQEPPLNCYLYLRN